jgi:WD repeat-containing protein 35
MRTELDENPELIDCGMRVAKIKWNAAGTILAIAGAQEMASTVGDKKEISVVQFYNPYGQHLKTLKVPGTGVAGITWEGTGLRLALAVDSYVFFANVRPDYKWGFFNKNTLVYSFTKLDRPEHCVIFWNSKTEEKYVKYIKRLVTIRCSGEHCVLVTKTDHLQQQDKKYLLIVCNSIGSPIDNKYISIEPKYVAMTTTHIFIADDMNVYVWKYKVKQGPNALSLDTSPLKKKDDDEYAFHIDDTAVRPFKGKFREAETSDHICSICSTEKHLFVARESGTIHQYSLPSLLIYDKFALKYRPQMLAANCDSSRLSVIDINGVFTLYRLQVKQLQQPTSTTPPKKTGEVTKRTGELEPLDIERKEVWDMLWSDDNPELFAIMEKTKMYTFRGTLPEEPKPSSAYLAYFNNLKIKAVLLDEIMTDPEHPVKDHIMTYESRSLRDTKKILSSVSLEDAFTFVKDNPHPRLFKLLAEAALEKLDFDTAYRSFVSCADYQGVQFVKKLKEFKDRLKQQAEVAAYFKNFDEAERVYKSIDRKDLAIDMRREVGDYFGVLQLLKDGGGDDAMKKEIYNLIGDNYFDRKMWNRALTHYLKSENYEKLIEVYYRKEDFKSMEKLIPILSDGHPLLLTVGERFASVGMSIPAVKAFLRAGDVKKAIDTCVELNQWDKAVELAEKNNIKDIEDVLLKYADNLMKNGLVVEAIEVFQASNRNMEAAKLLVKLGHEAGTVSLQPMKAKKLYVFAGLEVESVKRRLLDTDSGKSASMALTNLMEVSSGHDRALIENVWRGAEAYHFFLLCQRQLAQEQYTEAMNTALRLMNYDDILPLKQTYSLIALVGLYSQDYRSCSKAFTKLETAFDSVHDYRDALSKLAVNIFTRYSPTNQPAQTKHKCENCSHPAQDYESKCHRCHSPFYVCVATGRNIFKESYWTCTSCKHRALEQVMYKKLHCPLCHNPIDLV